MHRQPLLDQLTAYAAKHPEEAATVHEAARAFRHIGLDVVIEVPMAEKPAFAAIVTMSQKIKRLTGKPLRMIDWEGRDAGRA